MRDRVLLVGMMGAGKSTVGRLVAEHLGWPFVDTDERVELETGRSVSELFAEEGEAAFRAEEKRQLAAALAGSPPVVVSVGGGAVLDPDNRSLLRHAGLVVWLRASPVTLSMRVRDGAGRPLLSGSDPFEGLARIETERRPLFAEVAREILDVDDLTASTVALRVVDLVSRAFGPPRLADGNARS